MKKIVMLSLLSASLVFAGSYSKQANKVTKDLVKTLGGNLKKELQSKGAIAALKFCSTNAYKLTQGVSSKYPNISVKRISLKPRNPANTPSNDEAVILKAMQNLAAVGAKPKKIIQKKANKIYVYKPLFINKKACLICHGDVAKNNPKLAKTIADIYPSDKATGYKMGDLRGAIVVEIPKKEKKKHHHKK